MQYLTNTFVRRSLPALVDTKPRESGLRSWLEGGSFYIDEESSSDSLVLKNISATEFTSYQGFDYGRFALASFECMAYCRSDPLHRRNLSWPMLKAYYSGFFGGHAILRALGQSVIRLEPPQSRKLTDIGKLYCGPSFSVSSGTFDLRIIQNSDRTIDVTLNRMDESGGAHSVFWRRFKSFLTEMTTGISDANEPEANFVITRLQDLQSLLTARGASAGGTWLSTARNLINYQHEFGVWFPFGAAEDDVKHASNIGYLDIATARLDFDTKKQPLRALCAGSLFIAALNSDLATRLVAQSTKHSAHFAQNWRRLCQEVNAA